MKKLTLALFFLFATTLSFAANQVKISKSSYKNETKSETKSETQRIFYYILFEDGCFHLGYEQVEADGTWWIPCENDPSSHSNFMGMTFLICPYTRAEMANIC